MPRGVYPRTSHPHNWKGGRTKTPDGYILIHRPDHPGADVRGYVYEHRLVAEEMLGRPLQLGEEVHHRGARDDNRPEQLVVCGSRYEHRQMHSDHPFRNRAPDEPNELIDCACGCGSTFLRYDPYGRPRRYVSGHNTIERYRGGEVSVG